VKKLTRAILHDHITYRRRFKNRNTSFVFSETVDVYRFKNVRAACSIFVHGRVAPRYTIYIYIEQRKSSTKFRVPVTILLFAPSPAIPTSRPRNCRVLVNGKCRFFYYARTSLKRFSRPRRANRQTNARYRVRQTDERPQPSFTRLNSSSRYYIARRGLVTARRTCSSPFLFGAVAINFRPSTTSVSRVGAKQISYTKYRRIMILYWKNNYNNICRR